MKHIAAVMMILFAATMIGCSNGSSSGGTVAVSISPTSVTLAFGRTQQFTATVKNTANSAVTWQVNGTIGGNSSTGTITSSGLYTAPFSPASATVTAVSTADPTQSASATVSVATPISITPTTAAINLSGTVQFTATVIFSTNTAVTWQVNGLTGGNATVGTISTSGLYTAPASLPNPNSVTIEAIAQADTTQVVAATVTIIPPALVISPTGLTLAAGGQQAFTATVNGASVSPVWGVVCLSQAAGGCGTLSPGGTYTAPSLPPPGATVTITAKAADGSAVPASTIVSIQFSNASLAGQYAFDFGIRTAQELSAEAGTITFDGNGNVTSGASDRSNDGGGSPIAITGGTYQVGSDGRGTAVVQTDQGLVAWQFSLTNQRAGYVVRFDGNGNTASGALELQHADKFNLASIHGNYALSLAGISAGTSPTFMAMVGSLTADGGGNVTHGILDVNSNATATTNLSASGKFSSPSGYGRGTLTLTSALVTQTFAYYQVDETRLKLVEIDGVYADVGELVSQPAGPFTSASFNGRFAFTLTGSKGGASLGVGGLFTMSFGEISNRLLDGVNQTVFDRQGGYLVTDSTSGRTSVTWTVNNGAISQYVLYPRNDGGFVMLELDSAAAAEGIVFPQTLSNASIFSVEGNFAVTLSGTEPPSSNANENITGELFLPGGAPFTGVLDIDKDRTTTQGGVFQVGVFTVDPNTGRGQATALPSSAILINADFILYILSPDKALVLETDNVRVLTGKLERQY